MMKSIFITMVIFDVMAVIGSVVGIASCYIDSRYVDPLPWCLFLAWGIIGIIKDGLVYRGSEMNTTHQHGFDEIDSALNPKN